MFSEHKAMTLKISNEEIWEIHKYVESNILLTKESKKKSQGKLKKTLRWTKTQIPKLMGCSYSST